MNQRLVVIGAALAAAAFVAVSSCSESTCPNGCNGDNAVCMPGTTNDACGVVGSACRVCTNGTVCIANDCVGSSSGGGSATGGGTAASGGGDAASGGGTAALGGGTSATGGGTAAAGGGTASSGGGTTSSGGGTASTGGGTASSGGGTAASGGGSASSGGGSAASGGGTSGAGGGMACVPTEVGACTPNECATGNEINVGAYCTKGGNQCRQYSNLSCAIDLSSDGANFCIKLLCSANSDCGAKACCVGDGSSIIKACIPIECEVDDGGSVCPAP